MIVSALTAFTNDHSNLMAGDIRSDVQCLIWSMIWFFPDAEWVIKMMGGSSACKPERQIYGEKIFYFFGVIGQHNQRTNGPLNAHLISWPCKAQNIQNLENIW